MSTKNKQHAALNPTLENPAPAAVPPGEDFFRHLAESSPDILYLYRLLPQPGFEYINRAVTALTGYTPTECCADPELWLKLAHPEDRHLVAPSNLLQQLSSGAADLSPLTLRWISRDGRTLWTEHQFTPVHDAAGQATAIQGIARNITLSKQAEDFLCIQRDLGIALGSTSELLQALRLILEAALRIEPIDCGGIYLTDPLSGALELVVHEGLSPAFIASAARYNPIDYQAVLVQKGKPIYGSYAYVSQSPNQAMRDEKLLSLAVVPVLYEGQAIAAFNMASHTQEEIPPHARDMLESLAAQIGSAVARVQAEKQLSQSQENFQTLFNSLEDLLFIADSSGRLIRTNPAVEQRLGYSTETLHSMHILDVHPPERRQEAGRIVADMLAGKLAYCPIPLMTSTGSLIPVETRVTLGTWDHQQVLFGISRDISERLKAQEALAWQETLLRLVTDASPLGFLIVDHRSDKILYFNHRFCEIWGIEHQEEALQSRQLSYGELVCACLPSLEDAPSFTASLKSLADENNRSVLEDEIVFANGRTARRFSAQVRGSLEGESEHYFGRFYTYEDITQKKEVEEQIRSSLHEKELLLKEIHHRVKNNMQIITSLLGLQAVAVEGTPAYEAFRETQNRVKTMALIHERFYQSKDLERVNFGEYLKMLAIHLGQSYSKKAGSVRIFTSANQCNLSLEKAIPCGLIVNELVSNALKYAFPEGIWKPASPTCKPKIHVSLAECTPGTLDLVVQDNGVGLPPGFDWSNSDTLGLEIVASLVEQLHGGINVETLDGLKFSIQFSA